VTVTPRGGRGREFVLEGFSTKKKEHRSPGNCTSTKIRRTEESIAVARKKDETLPYVLIAAVNNPEYSGFAFEKKKDENRLGRP